MRLLALNKAVVIAFVALLSGGCATTSREAYDADPAIVSISGSELTYHGPVSLEANARLFLLASTSDERPQRLVITSEGGPIRAGMELGEWVFDEGLDVYVPEYCVSSCANYVFPAGKQKFLDNTAMLFWHGGALQERRGDEPLCDNYRRLSPNVECDEQKLRERLDRQMAELRIIETAFFSKIQVNQQITVLGQFAEFECQDGHMGWYYSIPDMEKLGVRDIVVYGGVWNPVPPSPDVKICIVVLGSHWQNGLPSDSIQCSRIDR